MKPGSEDLVDLAAKTLAVHARILDLSGLPVPSPKLARHRVTTAPTDETLAFLREHATAPFDAILVAWPSRIGRLMPLLTAMHGALAPTGAVLVCDLVWQTAPTLELLKAFAPAAGLEKIRPIEGFEMQAEHSGFAIGSRMAVDRNTWAHLLPPEQQAAIEADMRGAAKLGLWVLRPNES